MIAALAGPGLRLPGGRVRRVVPAAEVGRQRPHRRVPEQVHDRDFAGERLGELLLELNQHLAGGGSGAGASGKRSPATATRPRARQSTCPSSVRGIRATRTSWWTPGGSAIGVEVSATT